MCLVKYVDEWWKDNLTLTRYHYTQAHGWVHTGSPTDMHTHAHRGKREPCVYRETFFPREIIWMTTVTDQEKKDAKFQLALAAAGFFGDPQQSRWACSGGGRGKVERKPWTSPGHLAIPGRGRGKRCLTVRKILSFLPGTSEGELRERDSKGRQSTKAPCLLGLQDIILLCLPASFRSPHFGFLELNPS